MKWKKKKGKLTAQKDGTIFKISERPDGQFIIKYSQAKGQWEEAGPYKTAKGAKKRCEK